MYYYIYYSRYFRENSLLMEITIYIRPLLPDTLLIGNLFLDIRYSMQENWKR